MTQHWLVSATPGRAARFQLSAPGPASVGRAEGCQIVIDDKTVSKRHASLEWTPPPESGPGNWRLVSTASTGATAVNGVRLNAGIGLTLQPGDLLRFGSVWMRFVAIDGESPITELDDGIGGAVEAVSTGTPEKLAQHQLLLLLRATESIHRACSEAEVRTALVDAVAQATGMENVAFLRSLGEGNAEVLASAGSAPARFSRSMVRAAHSGPVMIADIRQVASPGMGASLERLSVQQAICIPLEEPGSSPGFLYMDSSQRRDPASLADAASIAGALVRMAAQMIGNLQRIAMEHRFAIEHQLMFSGTLHALIHAIDAKDPYTRGHSDRVAAFARLLAQEAGMPEDMVARAYLCGTVHDVGKIGVPEAVLCKPGRLTEEEFAMIRLHPATGHRILRDIPQLQEVLPGVLEHHERWDGSGYPNGLAGESISRLGRVVCIADCFDAMTSARVYRPGRPVREVLAEIERCAGTHFDPELAKTFIAIAPEHFAAIMAEGAPEESGPPA